MTNRNAIKKLMSTGFSVLVTGNQVKAVKGSNVIDFYVQDGTVHAIRSRGVNDEDDIQTDYFAGVYCNNLSQAIRISGV